MTTRQKPGFRGANSRTPADAVLDANDTTLLDMLDKLLNQGVVLNGDVLFKFGHYTLTLKAQITLARVGTFLRSQGGALG